MNIYETLGTFLRFFMLDGISISVSPISRDRKHNGVVRSKRYDLKELITDKCLTTVYNRSLTRRLEDRKCYRLGPPLYITVLGAEVKWFYLAD